MNLQGRRMSYMEDDKVYTLINFNRETMTLEVHIKDGDEEKVDLFYPFAHLPKNMKKELNPL
ncbi:MAG: hypothetical protein PHQ22_07625 [Sulfuricurvum sp.]|nr:hypothetical protein [Sulfuricurvum sp.]MDD5387043.1 hypothetical protein [Sulfuricurvum sp.]